jgi:hypothetical protein
MELSSQLAAEAIFVGATLFPVYAVWNAFIQNPPLKVFLTGVSYHLIAEYSGINAHYLENSHANNKRYGDLVQQHYAARDQGFEAYRWANSRY